VAEARLRKEPDFVAMRMPPGNATSRRLIAAAGAMGKAATNYTPTFLSSGLATDFLTKLQESTDALSASLAVRGHTVSAGAGATAGLDAEAARGRRALKVLDSLVVPLIADDDALMAQWRSAKRFRGKTPSLALTTAEASGTAAAATGGGEGGVPEGPKPTEGSVAEAVVQATA
jgi:hypothetical protein